MVSRARTFASFAKSFEDKTFVSSSISGTTTKTGTINIPLDTEDFTDYQIGQSSTAGTMVDPTTGDVTLTFAQANEANKKFTLHIECGYDSATVTDYTKMRGGATLNFGQVYSGEATFNGAHNSILRGFHFTPDGMYLIQHGTKYDRLQKVALHQKYNPLSAKRVQQAYTNADISWWTANGTRIAHETNLTNLTYDAGFLQSQVYDIHFKPDGTKLFMVGTVSRKVVGYDLSTAWDISTVSTTPSSEFVDTVTTNSEYSPVAVKLSDDGTKCYVGGAQRNTIIQYGLSTAWDLSTATLDDRFAGASTTGGDMYGVAPLDNGNAMMAVNTNQASVNVFTTTTQNDFTSGNITNGTNPMYELELGGYDYYGTNNYILEKIDNDCYLLGQNRGQFYTIELGTTYSLTLPNNVYDPLVDLFRGYRYQIDFSSNNADSGSAKWFITDVRSIRV